ncbi:MAG: hypothetical protein ACRC7R_09110 [Sarcina sp.]
MQFIRILNSSPMRMNFWVYYNEMHHATQSIAHTPFFKKGQYEQINLPEFANNITLKVYVEKSPGSRSLAFTISVKSRNNKCYELLGSTSLKLNEIKCDAVQNKGFIYFKNGTNKPMRGELIYTSGKEGFKDEGEPLGLDGDINFTIPVSATYIQFSVFILDSTGKWTRVNSFKFKTASIKKCYVSRMMGQSISINEVKCETLDGLSGSGSSTLTSIDIVNINSNCCDCCCKSCCKCC